ncbi:hypothetical protein CLM62_12495 [Streptomyces sp. SA15]|uniref:hypothetical protein n=1 Tax=Streptomyces sp. SA15 TaxID=934019 RepID=UPI000BB021C6|nr:hypothetical protein [Streptomyces sp. SA15]PAZ15610.1 hypothetical protein CLM62_12495 [Streptomyces sp. SA15]
MTAISLLAIKVDSPPEQIRLDTEHGLVLRLEAGVHLNLTDTSEETCTALAKLLMDAASLKRLKALRLREVA